MTAPHFTLAQHHETATGIRVADALLLHTLNSLLTVYSPHAMVSRAMRGAIAAVHNARRGHEELMRSEYPGA